MHVLLVVLGALACEPGNGVARAEEPAVTHAVEVVRLPDPPVAGEDTLLDRANRLLDEGEWQQALQLYRRLRPTAAVLKGTGIAQLRLWQLPSAVRTLRRARELAPRDAEIAGYLAEALTLSRQLDAAILVYREAVALDGTNVELRTSFALALAWSGDHQRAIAEYRAALELRPYHARARLGLAETLSWTRNFDRALAEYWQALAVTTDLKERSRAFAGAAQVLAWQGELQRSELEYRRALEANPRNIGALLGLGEVHEWQREYSAAKRVYEQILQLHPNHSGAKQKLLQLGWVR